MHVFIAGVMQGARLDNQIDDQNYRVRRCRGFTGPFAGRADYRSLGTESGQRRL